MKKIFLYVLLVLLWCNVGFAKTFIYSCIHEDQFQMIFKINNISQKIIHVSSYNTTAKKKFTVNEDLKILYWGDNFVWVTYFNDDGSGGLSFFDFKENSYLQTTIHPGSSKEYLYQNRTYNCFISS